MLRLLVFNFSLFVLVSGYSQISVSGYVIDSTSKEPIIGATVKGTLQGVQTNEYGYFSIHINSSDTLKVSSIGYTIKLFYIENSFNNGQLLQLPIVESNEFLDSLVIISKSELDIGGRVYLRSDDIKKLPLILGEKDPIKSLLYLPGVQSGVEGTSSFYVRGGNSGENLLLLDEATVYNANHLFGFFSVFNIDALKGMSFYKGNFPTQFGGRLSSVIDIHSNEGNMDRWHSTTGISFISSRLTIEGPLIKNKLSLSFSGRRTYLDALLGLFQAGKNDKYYYNFFDLNGKLKWKTSERTTILLSAYGGRDNLKNEYRKTIKIDDLPSVYSEDSYLKWGNRTITARINHTFGRTIFSNTSLIYSTYFSKNTSDSKTVLDTLSLQKLRSIDSQIIEKTVKTDLFWSPTIKCNMNFGSWISRYDISPKIERLINTEESLNVTNKLNYKGLDFGIFYEHKQELGSKVDLKIGLRAHDFLVQKKSYIMVEPRVSLNYALNKNSFVSVDYSKMNQFVNQIQSTSLGLSTDLWFISTDKIPPQTSDIFSIAFSNKMNHLEFSTEVYFRNMKKVLYLSSDQNIFLNDNINTNQDISDYVTQGEGVGAGLEFLLRKTNGKLNGFSSLTISRVIYKIDGIEFSKPFLPFQDRPINFNTVLNYKLKESISISGSWVYYSAPLLKIPKAFTNTVLYPNGSQQYETPYMVFNKGGGTRGKDYHRLDVTISFESKKKTIDQTLEIGVYNAYFRKNPLFYSVQNTVQKGTGLSQLELKEVSLLPIVPFVSYGFKF